MPDAGSSVIRIRISGAGQVSFMGFIILTVAAGKDTKKSPGVLAVLLQIYEESNALITMINRIDTGFVHPFATESLMG